MKESSKLSLDSERGNMNRYLIAVKESESVTFVELFAENQAKAVERIAWLNRFADTNNIRIRLKNIMR